MASVSILSQHKKINNKSRSKSNRIHSDLLMADLDSFVFVYDGLAQCLAQNSSIKMFAWKHVHPEKVSGNKHQSRCLRFSFQSVTVQLHVQGLSLCGILDAIFGPVSIKYAC